MKPFVNKHNELLILPEVPEEIRLVFYHLHTVGKRQKEAVPAITVALAVHVDGEVMGRGITVCSPDDYETGCFCKKEGRIRAGARALRAYKKASTGMYFLHPNALYVLYTIFTTGLYDEFVWGKDFDEGLKYEYMPAITLGEKRLLESKGL